MPLLVFWMLIPAFLSAQQMKNIQSSVRGLHRGFTDLVEIVSQHVPVPLNARKTSTYSFDGTDGRTGLSMSITYRYQIDKTPLTNVFTYAPDEANYYLAYLNGLQFFQSNSALTYQVVPLGKGGEKSYLWNTKDKTAILVPSRGDGVSQGFFLKIYFPQNITGEQVVVEDFSSRTDWAALQKIFNL